MLELVTFRSTISDGRRRFQEQQIPRCGTLRDDTLTGGRVWFAAGRGSDRVSSL